MELYRRKWIWKCPFKKLAQLNYHFFKFFCLVASKEAAYVYAITAAGVSHALARACSKGLIPDCGCGDLPKEEYHRVIRSNSEEQEFIWAGCSDNVKYGNAFGRRFIDSTEKQNIDARYVQTV